MERHGRRSGRDAHRAHAAGRATALLVWLVWLVAVLDRGSAAGLPGAHGPAGGAPAARDRVERAGVESRGALAPLTVDPWRDPPWRLRLIPGIGARRAARILAARQAAPGTAQHSRDRMAWLDNVDPATFTALRAVCGRQQRPGRPWPLRLTPAAEAHLAR